MLFEEHKAEGEIIQRLRDHISGADISEFPANPEEAFKTLSSATSAICVRYYNSRYAAPVLNPEGVLVQVRTVLFQCHIRTRNWSRQDKRADSYGLMAAVRNALYGWFLPDVSDVTKFVMAQDGFLDEQAGIWSSHVVVSCDVPCEAP
jgi:hypothetical protein